MTSNKEKYIKTLDFLNPINEEVNFIFIKLWTESNEIGTDIDVLLKTDEDFEKVKIILKKNNFFKLKRSRFIFWDNRNEKYKELWKHKSEKYSLIHLHKNVSWGGVKYLDKSVIFKNSIKGKPFGKNFFIPSPNEEFLIIISHLFFETHKLRLKDFLQLRYLINSGKLNMVKLSKHAKSFEWESCISPLTHYYKLAEVDESILPISLPRQILFKLRIKKMLSDLFSLKLQELFYEIKSYLIDFVSLFIMKPMRGF